MFSIFNKPQKSKNFQIKFEKVEIEEEVIKTYELNYQQNFNEVEDIKKEAESNQLCLLFEQPKMTKPIKIKSENPLRIKSTNNIIYTFKYLCPHCDASFTNKEKLRKHVTAHKIKEECSKCHMKLLGKWRLKKHSCNICEICSRQFNCKRSLLDHLRGAHQQETKIDLYECDFCGKKLTDTYGLINHMINFHMKVEKKFICDLCPMKFPKKSIIANHVLMSHQKLTKCEICGLKLKPINMRRHIKTMHQKSDEKFDCKKCRKSFKAKKNLQVHLKVHNKPFKCEKCGRKFQMHAVYKDHLMWHENPNIFTCEVCEKVFGARTNLTNHKKHVHLPDEITKIFKCRYCDYKAKKKGTLTRHEENVHRDVYEIE